MSETQVVPQFAVGDRVDSIYGLEHRGTVIEAHTFRDGGPFWSVRRDSDGFVWIGLPLTMLPLSAAN